MKGLEFGTLFLCACLGNAHYPFSFIIDNHRVIIDADLLLRD